MAFLDKIKGITTKLEESDVQAKIQNGVKNVSGVFNSLTKAKKQSEQIIKKSEEQTTTLPEQTNTTVDIVEQTSDNKSNVPELEKSRIGDGQVSNQEAAALFATTAMLVAKQYKDYKTQALNVQKELEEISLRNQNNLDLMKQAYQERKPVIDQILKGLDEQQKQLNYYKEKELTEEEHKTYQFLLVAITKQIDSLVHLYDTIMG